jgi:hypothetical protein
MVVEASEGGAECLDDPVLRFALAVVSSQVSEFHRVIQRTLTVGDVAFESVDSIRRGAKVCGFRSHEFGQSFGELRNVRQPFIEKLRHVS